MAEPAYYINQSEPPIIGKVCEGLYVRQYQENQQVIDPAINTYICFGGIWYRLYFEANTAFWRESSYPEPPINDLLDSGSVLNDLSGLEGIVGAVLVAISYVAQKNGTGVIMTFSEGETLRLIHNADLDVTSLEQGST